MVLVTLSCVLTILVLNAFYRGTNGRRVPRWAKLYIMRYLGRVVCSKHSQINYADLETHENASRSEMGMKVSDLTIQTELDHDAQPQSNGLIHTIGDKESDQNRFLKHLDDKKEEDEINSEWRDLANIMDRLFLVFYSLITVIVTLVFMLQCAIH